MTVLVALVVIAASGKVAYQYVSARNDARDAAEADARFAADLAARDIRASLDVASSTLETVKANPQIDQAFDLPEPCPLTFSTSGPFTSGHVDIVGDDGTVACTSLPNPAAKVYAGAPWMNREEVVGPVVDARTGKTTIVVAVRVSPRGFGAVFLDLDSLSAGLASSLGGPHQLQFSVQTGDAVALDSGRIYASATVPGVNWQVFAGASRADALAAADNLSNRQLGLAILGLLAFLVGAYLIYRNIARPIRELSRGVRAASAEAEPDPLEVSGPAEIAHLVEDFNALIAAQAQSRLLEARLRQSERLESLGQLAGGIAHDFNNLLAAIMNYASFVAEESADNPAIQADAEQIQAAAEQAARLTKQLLIFGRRDAVHVEVVDLNAVVADVHHLLSRSIGEHIDMVVQAGTDVPNIRVDRGQLEQVLVNLAVNARDAMPHGGTLTFETGVAVLDEDYARAHVEVTPGPYAELCVSDTGSGMSKDIAAHIFEPFFTTKAEGLGTGLGLATLYGIVTEAGGSVSVYSEPALGTTFRVYFPAVDVEITSTPALTGPRQTGNGETILVVEDEAAILEVTARILRQNGYRVLEASTFDTALAHATDGAIDLLLTDSVMPEISGRSLAERIDELCPGCPVLFMSGYSQGVLAPQRVLPDGAELIQKPFNQRELLQKVHTVLAAPREDPN